MPGGFSRALSRETVSGLSVTSTDSLLRDAALDAPDFDEVQWARSELLTQRLPDLVEQRTRLEAEASELDAELQGMVSSNYSNYAEGTRLVGGLKDAVSDMTDELEKLRGAVEVNQSHVRRLADVTADKSAKVRQLVAITATLNGVQLLLELPARMQRSIEEGEVGVGVRLWEKGRGVLRRHARVPSLAHIQAACEPIVDKIESLLWATLGSGDPEAIRSAVASLRELGGNRRDTDAELRARLMGEVARSLDANAALVVACRDGEADAGAPGASLCSGTATLATVMRAAGFGDADVSAAAVQIVSPRLAAMASRAFSAAVDEELAAQDGAATACGDADTEAARSDEAPPCPSETLAECARRTAEDVAIVAAELEEVSAACAAGWAAKTLNTHVAGALAGGVFAAGTAGAAATRERAAREALARAQVAYYLSQEECLREAGLEVEEGAVKLAAVASGLLDRHAALQEGVVAQRMRAADRSGACFGAAAVAELVQACGQLYGTPLRQDEVRSHAQRLIAHTMAAALEGLRRQPVVEERRFRSLRAGVRTLRGNTGRLGVAEEEAERWTARALDLLADMWNGAGDAPADDGADDVYDGEASAPPPPAAAAPAQPARAKEGGEEEEACLGAPAAGSWTRSVLLGRWAHGNVFLGTRADGRGTRDAVKALSLDGAGADDAAVLVAEAQRLSALRHPNVVSLRGCAVVEEGGAGAELCFFSEVVTGLTLGALVRRSPVPWEEHRVAAVVAQVAEGLAFLHARGVVHADVKSDSVVVEEATGVAKVADYALVRPTEKQLQKQEQQQQQGSALWMAPEVVNGGACTAESDIWSLGILTCEALCCGETPWPAFSSAGEALQVIGSWAEQLPPGVPQRLSRVTRHFLCCALRPVAVKRWSTHALLNHTFLRDGGVAATGATGAAGSAGGAAAGQPSLSVSAPHRLNAAGAARLAARHAEAPVEPQDLASYAVSSTIVPSTHASYTCLYPAPVAANRR
eukprot:Rhum_TRINITY_DN24945_c0_g1::Rhum_TRINITY_DN24945_c0_g1_i1::g.180653::m.180653